MIRLLAAGDEAHLYSFLQEHADSTLFLRSNLRSGGIVDGGRPLQATYAGWIEDDTPERIRGVISHAWNGNLILQTRAHAGELARAAIRGSNRSVKGLIGCWDQVQTTREALGLVEAKTLLSSQQDLFSLELAELKLPGPLRRGEWICRLPSKPEMELLSAWRRDFQVDTIGEPPFEGMIAECRRGLERHLGEGSLFVLVDGQTLASTCTFNARVPDCVQVGGVWTPPDLRNRGYARAVVAGALELAREEGVSRAVLFTDRDNHAARAAYQGMGFQRVGDYGIVLFRDEHRPT